MVILFFLYFVCIYPLKFFSKKELCILPIYLYCLIIYYSYGVMDIYFGLCVIIQYFLSLILKLFTLFQLLPLGVPVPFCPF